MKTSEFRYNNKLGKNKSKTKFGHPTYVFEKHGEYYCYIPITHSPTYQNRKNIKLNKNPNPNDSRQSYINSKPSVDHKSAFSKKKKNWSFGKSDLKKVKKVKNKIKYNQISKVKLKDKK